MAEINLLPRKEFEITNNAGEIIKGQYGTWALKRFCDKKNISLKEVGEMFMNPAIGHAIEYILCAIEQSARKTGSPFSMTDVQLCELIDELGGLQSDDFIKLFNHSGDEEIEKKTELPPDPPVT